MHQSDTDINDASEKTGHALKEGVKGTEKMTEGST
jgi:hypothetical protein